jgi:farnesyl diphosphate synthase
MGLTRAKEQAAMLVDQAIDHLSSYGQEAELLRAIAHYVLERDH